VSFRSRSARRPPWPTLLFAVAGLIGLALAALGARDGPGLYEDERELAAAAASLLRHGVLDFAPPGAAPPAPSAFREPAYPALVALAWRLAGSEPPSTAAQIEHLPDAPRAWRPVRALNLALLALAAAAAGLGVARLAGAAGGALAFALVAASPALHATSTQLMSENLAAAHFALAGLSLLVLARGGPAARVAGLAALATLPLARAEAVLLLPVALLVAAARRPAAHRPRARHRAAGLVLTALALALPSALWLARNSIRLGHPVLADRGGLALAVRAELDAEVARHGALSAALAWTPLEAARRASMRAAPQASWLDYRPSGAGNFYLRTLRRWQQERGRPGVDPLAADRAWGRAALARFASAPWDHARAAAAVAVRGLFAERSPGFARPFDVAFGLGLLLAAGIVVATAGALRRRELPALAFLAPAWILFGFHVAATELLPRYAAPLLPLAWSGLALAVLQAGPRRWRAAGAAVQGSSADQRPALPVSNPSAKR
jgi:hypothetical protein